MFRFLGLLMGVSIRTGSPLSLNLAEPMWKLVAGSGLTPSDITEIDKARLSSDPYVMLMLCLPMLYELAVHFTHMHRDGIKSGPQVVRI